MVCGIKQVQQERWTKCTCCGEQIRSLEKFFQVYNLDTGRNVRGERYCKGCETYAFQNNNIIREGMLCNEERHLRQMENYAAYQAAGCVSAYWDDRNAGYVE